MHMPVNKSARAKRRGAPVKHYLLSIYVAPDMRMHGYLMCPDRRYAAEAGVRMVDKAKEAGAGAPLMSMILMTQLSMSDVIEQVRAIFSARIPGVRRLLATAVDYHFSAGAMSTDDPDGAWLMGLH